MAKQQLGDANMTQAPKPLEEFALSNDQAPKKKKVKYDPELLAIAHIKRIVDALPDNATRRRVVGYVTSTIGTDPLPTCNTIE